MGWLAAPDYALARSLFQHGLAAVYLVAFLVAAREFVPLLGTRGLLPVPRFVAAAPFRRAPSLFHLHYSDRAARLAAWTGAALALVALLGIPDAWPAPAVLALWAALWVLYLSFVNVGQTFYAFGWESLLLETGFLAIFLGPPSLPVAAPLVWLVRWLLFRVELGAGLIKLRGDRCWRDLTCLDYHHETQPMPNPLSWYFHHLPRWWHRLEVLGNHVAQLVMPFLLFAPQPIASFAGAAIIATQAWLVLSGNFAWLNLVTIVLAVMAFDDAALGRLLSPAAAAGAVPLWHGGLVLALAALIAVLSYRPARNLLSPRQLMNASFDPFHLVGTYGAFGSVTKERFEVVIEGTADVDLGPQTIWREYEFIGKPGDPGRRPPQVAPFHLRLDWLMWFAALSSARHEEWFPPLIGKLLAGDRAIRRLLRHDPFPDAPPRAIRARYYRYRFTTPRERRATGAWWVRTLVGDYLPPTSMRPAVPRQHNRPDR